MAEYEIWRRDTHSTKLTAREQLVGHDEAMDASTAETANLYQEWARVDAHGSSAIDR